MSKLEDSLKAQKEQLAQLMTTKEQLVSQLATTKENILQLKGAIAALEYATSLGLVEPEKDPVKAEG